MKGLVKSIKSVAAAGLVALIINAGCDLNSYPEEEIYSKDPYSPNFRVAEHGEFPAIDDLLYFSTNYMGLSNFQLKMGEGCPIYPYPFCDSCSNYDGTPYTNYPPYEVYENHRGGVGDTLEIVDYNKGIYFQWAWAGLHTISVFGNWQGEIDETGIKLGNSREDFIASYPNSQRDIKRRFDPNCESWVTIINSEESRDYHNPDGEIRLNADIDNQGKIFRLRIGAWDGDNYNGYWGP